jgi:hypothetical protein
MVAPETNGGAEIDSSDRLASGTLRIAILLGWRVRTAKRTRAG